MTCQVGRVVGGNMFGMSDKTDSAEKVKSKPGSVRHTRAIKRDRSKRPTTAPSAEAVEALLEDLVHPAVYNQLGLYRQLGLRERILSLPVMVAFVLSLIWRQVGSVGEAVRALQREGFLWTSPTQVSQQALSLRLRTFPAELFERVLLDVLPRMHERVASYNRPLPPAVAHARRHFSQILALDGSTLDVLLRKVGLLSERAKAPLAGRIAALLDVCSQLPCQIWYEENPQAHDQTFWQRALVKLSPKTLVIFDLGFLNHEVFDQLTDQQVSFVTRAKSNAVYQIERVIRKESSVHDRVVRLGGQTSRCRHSMRLIEYLYQGKWYRYLTNVQDPEVLPAEYVVALYYQRWRIEDAFNIVKRLLGLAFFWVGSSNGVQVQLWATWLLYAVLVDLTQAVAEKLNQPFRALSLEMVYRGLYHFTQASHRGETTDPIAYLAAPEQKDLGILKRKRPTAATKLAHLTPHCQH